ncbi:MAG: RNA 3'-phosphate cyclase [Thermoprotei archaeon]|nr:MAG: RNA 3'-phosphate cyclase [Thermoprotei archaeon]
MIKIDGATKSGSGTILRLSIALASILGEELYIYNIRRKRSNPGLRPQHLESVRTAARVANADITGAKVGSMELRFKPRKIRGGEYISEIGTAGSIPMLFMSILPICIFADKHVRVIVRRGGTDTKHAPTINYLKYILLPMLRKMGINAHITVKKYGYYPKGMGEAILEVDPVDKLKPIILDDRGKFIGIEGISVCTFLKDRRVADRQADAAKRVLSRREYRANINVVYDFSNPLQKGSSIVLWAKYEKTLLGSDAIGEIRKTSEAVGMEAANKLLEEIDSNATVDIHLSDMLIPYIGLAPPGSIYYTRTLTDHTDTNIWLVEEILGIKIRVEKTGNLYKIYRV